MILTNSSKSEDFHLRLIIFFLVIMLIEEKCHLKLLCFSFVIKLSILKISFYSEEIMNHLKSTNYMDFMINVHFY